MDDANNIEIRGLRPGVNHTGVRDHNERLVLSLIQRHGEMPATDLARHAGLSAQTVSNILRRLETDGFLLRGTPQRGRVGKPSVPMALDPDGALSIGLKIGRRSADLALMNLHGEVLNQRQITYAYPMPDEIFGYLKTGMEGFIETLSAHQRGRLCGIGIAAPSELWSWSDTIGAPEEDFSIWAVTDFDKEVRKFSDLPLFTENDGTAAARAEHAFGRGREFHDYAYLFLGSFIGGGVVIDGAVRRGPLGNAGAIGPLRTAGRDGVERPLLDTASLYLLEAQIARAGKDPGAMWHHPQDWNAFAQELDPWIAKSAREIAKACRQICAVFDFEAILIDGAFPPEVRRALVFGVRAEMERLDMRGLVPPRIEQAAVGHNARVIGAASIPVFSQFFLN